MSSHHYARVLVAAIAAVVLLSGSFARDAAARSYHHSRSRRGGSTSQLQRAAAQFGAQQARANIARAQAAAAAASQQAAAAKVQIQAGVARSQSAALDVKNTKSGYEQSNTGRKNIEADIEAAQPDDSEFGRARREWEQADKAFQEAQNRVLNSPSYKAAYQQALDSPGRALLLPKVRSNALDNDSEYQSAKARLKAAQMEYDRLRHELYQHDPTWQAASRSTLDSRAAQANAMGQLRGGLIQKSDGMANLRAANATAAAAQAAIWQNQAALRQLQSVASRYHGSRRYSHHNYSRYSKRRR